MITAVLGCVHGNLAALEAVLADARDRGAERVVCLGDVVGLGPDPAACVDAVRGLDLVLRGEAEDAVLAATDPIAPAALRMWRWQRGELFGEGIGRARQVYLAALPPLAREGEVSYAYRPDDPVADGARLAFAGQTHGAGARSRGRFLTAAELRFRLRLRAGQRYQIQVGSVGWPTDGDPRAMYVLRDGDVVEWVRVSYAVERTILRLRRLPCAARIRELLARGLRRGSCLAS